MKVGLQDFSNNCYDSVPFWPLKWGNFLASKCQWRPMGSWIRIPDRSAKTMIAIFEIPWELLSRWQCVSMKDSIRKINEKQICQLSTNTMITSLGIVFEWEPPLERLQLRCPGCQATTTQCFRRHLRRPSSVMCSQLRATMQTKRFPPTSTLTW